MIKEYIRKAHTIALIPPRGYPREDLLETLVVYCVGQEKKIHMLDLPSTQALVGRLCRSKLTQSGDFSLYRESKPSRFEGVPIRLVKMDYRDLGFFTGALPQYDLAGSDLKDKFSALRVMIKESDLILYDLVRKPVTSEDLLGHMIQEVLRCHSKHISSLLLSDPQVMHELAPL